MMEFNTQSHRRGDRDQGAQSSREPQSYPLPPQLLSTTLHDYLLLADKNIFFPSED